MISYFNRKNNINVEVIKFSIQQTPKYSDYKPSTMDYDLTMWWCGFLGPSRWGIVWRECKGGAQSPVDLKDSKCIKKKFNLKFNNKGEQCKGYLINNGKHQIILFLNPNGEIIWFQYKSVLHSMAACLTIKSSIVCTQYNIL